MIVEVLMRRTVVGVDGCKGGWIGVAGSAESPRILIAAGFADLLAAVGENAVVAVDMPIGLPGWGGKGGRACERALREKLGKGGRSVFSIPSRAAVYAVLDVPKTMDEIAACHHAALHVAKRTSTPPTGFSRQALMILPKIREIDGLLRVADGIPFGSEVHESHPEGAFWRMNGGRRLEHRKKVKGRVCESGMAERRSLLIENGFDSTRLQTGFAQARRCPPRISIGVDDFLDACAMAVVARRISADEAEPLPKSYGKDEKGLPMVIWI